MTTYFTRMASPVGALVLTGTSESITGLYLRDPSPEPGDPGDPGPFRAALEQLEQYFAGERQCFDLPLQARGTAFQQRVWAALQEIPYGQTTTYGKLAARVGTPAGSRAVGLANGRNPISLIVPCHRVIGADGSLTGYSAGLERKRWLLAHEAAGERPSGVIGSAPGYQPMTSR